MKNLLFYIRFILFMIGAGFKRLSLERLKKSATDEQIEAYINKYLLDWANFTVRARGLNLRVEGKENLPEGNFVLVANHQGDLDIPVVVAATERPMGFVAKKEMENLPLISYWMREIKCVFIDRENPREGLKAIIQATNYLKQGYSMAIFPEGTRSKSRQMGEFKKGSLKMALKSGVPIVPVTVDGTYKALEVYEGPIKDIDLKVIIDKPIEVKDLSKEEKEDIYDRVRDIIEKNLYK